MRAHLERTFLGPSRSQVWACDEGPTYGIWVGVTFCPQQSTCSPLLLFSPAQTLELTPGAWGATDTSIPPAWKGSLAPDC